MLTIVEGMDNTGKSSLVSWLQKESGQCGMRVDLLKSDRDVHQQNFIFDIIHRVQTTPMMGRNNHLHIICDRIPIMGEYVYGPILRNSVRFDLRIEDMWHLFLGSVTTHSLVRFIYCRPSRYDTGTKPEMDGVRENRMELLSRYDLMAMKIRDVFDDHVQAKYPHRFITYDYQEDPDYKYLNRRL